MKESQIQSKIIKYLESKGGFVVNGIYSKKGIPDLIACIPFGKNKHVFVGCEVKKPETRKNTSKLQELQLNKIKEAAGLSMVACSVEDVKEVLDEYIRTHCME